MKILIKYKNRNKDEQIERREVDIKSNSKRNDCLKSLSSLKCIIKRIYKEIEIALSIVIIILIITTISALYFGNLLNLNLLN
jgi:hypothetical protein